MKTPEEWIYYRIDNNFMLDDLIEIIQKEAWREAKEQTEKDIKTSLRSAFEAGMIFEGGAKGNTSLWNDHVSKGFNNYISPILKLNK